MCGFVGLIADGPVATDLIIALQAIQHRGQDAAGLGTWEDGRVHMRKGLGMISEAVPPASLPGLSGHAGIAHVRYPTAGAKSTQEDAQPFRTRSPGILLAHNGNVTNVPEVTEGLKEQGIVVLSSCDAEPILLVFAAELRARRSGGHSATDVVEAVRSVYRRVKGAYSVVAMVEVDGTPTLVAFRDPHGIRPGVYGQRADGAWMAASESVALDVHDIPKTDDLPVGDVLFLRPGQAAEQLPVTSGNPRPCVFERIYFARPDSVMEDGRVNRLRWLMGRQLAQEWRAKGFEADVVCPFALTMQLVRDADVVVAVPDTSRPAAMAMADELGVRHREGFIKNRYTGRTFIMPDQASRDAALRLKLNPIREIFEGQRVLLVDDSIVRGSTMRRIVQMLRRMEPAALHVAIFSPAVRHPCFYGIDMPSPDELVAAQVPADEVEAMLTERFGADSVSFLSLDGLAHVTGGPICAACFDGQYVVPVSVNERAAILSDRRT